MTTAHRPTWNSAKGSNMQGGNLLTVPSRMYSAKDLPGYQKMSARQIGQDAPEEILQKDFKQELLQKENQYQEKRNQEIRNQINQAEEKVIQKQIKFNNIENPFPQDQDDDDNYRSQKSDQEEEGASDMDSDDELLMQEFEKIKRERELENQKKVFFVLQNEQKKEEILEQQTNNLQTGNPLMQSQGYSMERKWFEDTIFKNQTRTEAKQQKRFINDNLRSDFHKKFMTKYVHK